MVAFILLIFYLGNKIREQLMESMAFHIPYDIFQLFIVAAYYHAYVAWHNAPGIYLKPFLLPAVLPAFYYFILLLISRKNIYPVYGGKADEYILLLSQNLYLRLMV